MPNFVNPFEGNNLGKKIDDEELARSLRFSIAGESEAIQLYQQISEATDNNKAKKVLLSIADEEKVHIGELMSLLFLIDRKEKIFYDQGFKEVSGKK